MSRTRSRTPFARAEWHYGSAQPVRSFATVKRMPIDALPVELATEDLDLVVDNLLHAGAIGQRSYSEQDKWDIIAFAHVLWRLGWNHVEAGLRERGLKVWYEENSLRFELGGFTCAIYAGGHSAQWDVRLYDFTRSRKRREAVNDGQGQLFDPSALDGDLAIEAHLLRSLTFVYCGDPAVGIAALYLGAAVDQRGATRWAWVRCLYRSDEGGDDVGHGRGIFPAFGSQPAPDVRVEPRRPEEAAESNSAA